MGEDGDIPKAQDQIRILGYNYFRGDETGVTKDARDRGRKRERVRKKRSTAIARAKTLHNIAAF